MALNRQSQVGTWWSPTGSIRAAACGWLLMLKLMMVRSTSQSSGIFLCLRSFGIFQSFTKVRAFEAKKVEADSDQRVLLDVDGEPLGALPVVIEMVPGALPLIMDN